MLDTDPELVLFGRDFAPTRLTEMGFDFACPMLDAALSAKLHSKKYRPLSGATQLPAGLLCAKDSGR